MSEANKQVSRLFTELFNTDDAALADEVFTADVVIHGLAPADLEGVDAVKSFVARFRTAFPDNRSTVEDHIAEGDRVVTRWRARGTHQAPFGPVPASGRPVEIGGVTIERFAGGRIAEVWVVMDELGLMRQLGAIPDSEPIATA
jgi:steroid delta-isomerase-like uncharacterized protein